MHTVPNSAKIHYYYANTLLKKYLDQPIPQNMIWLDKAEAAFKRSYEINPKFHHSTYNIGLIQTTKNNAQEALKWLNYTLKISPGHIKSHEQLTQVYGRLLGQPDQALKHLRMALQAPAGRANATNYQYLGIILAMKGQIKEAEEALLKSIEQDPRLAKSYLNLGFLYMNNNQAKKGQEYLNKAYQIDPSLQPKAN